MRPPPKAILPLIEMISKPETSVDAMMETMQKADPAQLKRNAFYLLQAIPHPARSSGLIMFASVHHAVGAESGMFAQLADIAIRGHALEGKEYVVPDDADAHDFLEFMLDRKWMPIFTSALIYSCAYGKRRCASLLVDRGFYKQCGYGGDWAHWLHGMDEDKTLMMAKVLIDVVKPKAKDLVALRKAAKPGSALADYLQDLPVAS
jgi:hypothetical protein